MSTFGALLAAIAVLFVLYAVCAWWLGPRSERDAGESPDISHRSSEPPSEIGRDAGISEAICRAFLVERRGKHRG